MRHRIAQGVLQGSAVQVDFTPKLGAKKRRPRVTPKEVRQVRIEEVRERMRCDDWDGAASIALVPLYWCCHEKVYGTHPAELDNSRAWTSAKLAAGNMVKRQFDGDMHRAIVFMRWVWTKEQDREQWARRNEKPSRRLSWQNMFWHDFLITDWRVAAARQQGGG